MTKKVIAVVIGLTLILSVALSGCSANGIMKILAIDTDTYDPATETVADMTGKTVSKSEIKSGDFTYTLYSDGTASITKYSGSDTVLSIPAEIDGNTVIGLENKALYESKITELILPDTLEIVGNFAALHCEKLEKITFGKNIKVIGVSAFESEGDNTKSLGKGSLKTIVWNGAPERIGEKAFLFNDKLTEIVLPAGVKTIEEWAFAKCYSADKIILGDGLEFIGDHAFLKCRAVKEISIPGSCKTIDVSAFYQCSSAEKITLGNGIETLKKGAFEECSALTEITVPDSVTVMEAYIFYNCSSLKTCKIGASVTSLDKDIFTGDKNVTVIAPAGSAAEQYAKENKVNLAHA
ncbi:MAG: leucine-rich repeat protein [Candidatus Fimenecus sp.]